MMTFLRRLFRRRLKPMSADAIRFRRLYDAEMERRREYYRQIGELNRVFQELAEKFPEMTGTREERLELLRMQMLK